jgi:hypothetical protein
MPRSSLKKNAKDQPASSADVSYNEFKEYEGRKYTGMKIGRSHKWYYDQGEWKEKKITPDLWQISYAVTKRRAGRAPEGSGVPVGTAYHWYVLAHQNVTKLNANDYTTSLSGLKFKTQRKRMIQFLEQVIEDLRKAPEVMEPEQVPEAPQARRTAPPSVSRPTRRRARTSR